MNTTRFAAIGGLVAVLVAAAAVACTDTHSSNTPAGPLPPPNLSTFGPQSADVVANNDPMVWRRIPVRSRWIGQEHNRLLHQSIQRYNALRAADPAKAKLVSRDCDWVFGVVKENLAVTAKLGGFEGSEQRVFNMARDIAPKTKQCRALVQPLSLFGAGEGRTLALAALAMREGVASSASTSAAKKFDDEDQALEIIDRLEGEIASASGASAIDNAVNRAVSAAGSLESAELVYAVASVAAGSSGYWSSAGGGDVPMNVLTSTGDDAQRFMGFVGADVSGAAAALRSMKGLPIPWQLKGAIALLVGLGSSFYHFLA